MVTVTYNDSRDKGTVGTVYSVTNWATDSALDCTANQISGSACVCAQVLGTLITDLIKQGILKGSSAT